MSVNRVNTTKWRWQLVPRARSSHSERAVADYDVVRGIATEPDVADLRPALAVAAADGMMRSDQITWCFAVQATVNSHAQLVLNTLLDRKPMMMAKQTSNVVPPGHAGDQTNGRVKNGLQALNVAVGKTSEYNVTVVEPTMYQGGDQSGQCVCWPRPLDGFNPSQSTDNKYHI